MISAPAAWPPTPLRRLRAAGRGSSAPTPTATSTANGINVEVVKLESIERGRIKEYAERVRAPKYHEAAGVWTVKAYQLCHFPPERG